MAEDVISGEGSKNPGAACNQLSGLLHGVQKRRKEKKKVWSKWKAGVQQDSALNASLDFPTFMFHCW